MLLNNQHYGLDRLVQLNKAIQVRPQTINRAIRSWSSSHQNGTQTYQDRNELIQPKQYYPTKFNPDKELEISNGKTNYKIRYPSRIGTFYQINQASEWKQSFQQQMIFSPGGNSAGQEQDTQNQQSEKSNFSITYLGTSSGTPTSTRNTSGIVVNLFNEWYLVDCGGGTVYQVIAAGLNLRYLKAIFITHLHGDHQFGIVSLLKAINSHQINYNSLKTHNPKKQHKQTPTDGQFESKKKVETNRGEENEGVDQRELLITGPPGLFKTLFAQMKTLCLLDSLVYKIRIVEHVMLSEEYTEKEFCDGKILYIQQPPDQASIPNYQDYEQIFSYSRLAKRQGLTQDECLDCVKGVSWTMLNNSSVNVQSATLRHAVPCIGYVFTENATNHTSDQKQQNSGQIKQKQQKSPTGLRKAVILGDTCNSEAIYGIGKDCDVLSHEATFEEAQNMLADRACHSTSRQAGLCASDMNANTLLLTHFSQRIQSFESNSKDNPKQQRTTEVQDELQFNRLNTQNLRLQASYYFKGRVFTAYDFFTYNIPQKKLSAQHQKQNQQQQQYQGFYNDATEEDQQISQSDLAYL